MATESESKIPVDAVINADGIHIYDPQSISISPSPSLFKFQNNTYTVEKLDAMTIDELIILRNEIKKHITTLYSSLDYACLVSMTAYNFVSHAILEKKFG